jgi:hypothetical protein
MDVLQDVLEDDLNGIAEKDESYGGSWLKRGGVGAWMMACRKMDRLETQLPKYGYDIFAAVEDTANVQEGVLDDIRDLRRYLALIEAACISRR